MLLAAVPVTFTLLYRSVLDVRDTERHAINALAAATIPGLVVLEATHDPYALERALTPLRESPLVASIVVRGRGGTDRYVHSLPQPPQGSLARMLLGDLLDHAVELALPPNAAALASIRVTPAVLGIDAMLTRMLAWILLTIGVLVALAVLAADRVARRHVLALRPAMRWAHECARGNYRPKTDLATSGGREIIELNQAVRAASASVQHYIERLSETRELWQHNEKRLRTLIEGMQEILFELDDDGRLTFLNPAWERLTGFGVEDTLGKPLADFVPDATTAHDFHPSRLPDLTEGVREISLRTADSRLLWLTLDAKAQRDSEGRFTGVIGTLGDITRSVELNRLLTSYQDELYHMSVTDPLTGLYNRRHFDTQLEVILADHLPQNRPVCLLLIDLDGFKFINDTYGHPLGDEVLRATAELLRGLVRRNDYIARMAGDEFAMVLKNTGIDDAQHIAEKVHEQIHQKRIALPVGHMQLQSSIGVAEAPTHGRNAQELVSAADVALYHSKRAGRNRIEVLSPDTSRAVMSIFSQGFDLRNALAAGNIQPAFQPIYDMQHGEPVAYEVLARMHHKGVVVQAKDFIAVAGELGLTREVDLHIIRLALATTPPEQALFLNVDLSCFSDVLYVRDLSRLLERGLSEGRQITLEITERDTVPITDTLRSDIARLRALGCKLALDDFGSGYSTYNFLNQFRPDYLKIEGSFVRGMLTNDADHKIVTHIHELANAFGMQTIAECVEDEATQCALREIGIRNAQGWLYGAPQFVH